MSASRTCVLLVAATVSVAALSGCGSDDDGKDQAVPPPVLATVPVVDSPADIRLPIDSYYPSKQEDLTIQRARLGALKDCMADQGFGNYQPPPAEPQLAGPSRERLFGQIDPDDAAAFGYHGGPAPDEKSFEDERKASAPTAEEDRALTGLDAVGEPITGGPKGGCLREAERRIHAGADKLDLDLLENIDLEANSQAEADERLVKAFDAWSTCMTTKGYEYATPWEANDDPKWSGPAATKEEIAVATADVACKQQTKLPGLWLGLMSAYQDRLIEKNALALAEWKAATGEALKSALSSSGSSH